MFFFSTKLHPSILWPCHQDTRWHNLHLLTVDMSHNLWEAVTSQIFQSMSDMDRNLLWKAKEIDTVSFCWQLANGWRLGPWRTASGSKTTLNGSNCDSGFVLTGTGRHTKGSRWGVCLVIQKKDWGSPGGTSDDTQNSQYDSTANTATALAVGLSFPPAVRIGGGEAACTQQRERPKHQKEDSPQSTRSHPVHRPNCSGGTQWMGRDRCVIGKPLPSVSDWTSPERRAAN